MAADANEAASRPDPAGESARLANADPREAPSGPWMPPPAGVPGLDRCDGRSPAGAAGWNEAGRPWRARRHVFGARGRRYAALDLGTNNCRLLVARATRDGFRVVDAFSRIIRLGEGITASGRLGEPAILRAVDALRVCRAKMRNRGVTRARLIATEACRSAANGLDFLKRVREDVGIELEIVDRETEARLAATGCTPLVDPEAEGVILFDIGGGSSELVMPSPSRIMRENASTTRKLSRVARATSRRQLLVPRSSAA